MRVLNTREEVIFLHYDVTDNRWSKYVDRTLDDKYQQEAKTMRMFYWEFADESVRHLRLWCHRKDQPGNFLEALLEVEPFCQNLRALTIINWRNSRINDLSQRNAQLLLEVIKQSSIQFLALINTETSFFDFCNLLGKHEVKDRLKALDVRGSDVDKNSAKQLKGMLLPPRIITFDEDVVLE